MHCLNFFSFAFYLLIIFLLHCLNYYCSSKDILFINKYANKNKQLLNYRLAKVFLFTIQIRLEASVVFFDGPKPK